MKKIIAVTLIELIISITAGSIIILLLGNIVNKKLNATAFTYEKGTYYCWKDWNGNLYQKTPMSGIQKVTTCKIKVPKSAKNIQSFVIGGGSGGHVFNKDIVNKYLNTKRVSEELSSGCVKATKYDGYTKVYDAFGDTNLLSHPNGAQQTEIEKTLMTKQSIYKHLNLGYTNFLLTNNHCYISMYNKNARSYYLLDMTKNPKYYSEGNNKSMNNCDEALDINETGTCYKDGYIKNSSYSNITLSNSDIPFNVNQLSVNTIKTDLSFEKTVDNLFKKSNPGELAMGSAVAGKTYEITANDIGSGGSGGQNGKSSRLDTLIAQGGQLKNENLPLLITLKEVSSIKDQAESYADICDSTKEECNGILNSSVLGTGIELKSDIIIDADFDPSDYDEATASGFGLFGASGASQNCNIKYYSIKSIDYNNYHEEIDKPIASFGTCKNNLTKGMGGAIIIKWE